MLRSFAVLVVLFAASPAYGQTLYGITSNLFLGPVPQLITINTITGTGTVVGPLSSGSCVGLGFRGTKLYTFEQTAGKMAELDTTTGATLNMIDVGFPPNSYSPGDLAFRSDGMGFVSAGGSLYRFDITNPSALTIVGPLNVDGLSFNGANTLYAFYCKNPLGSDVYTINQATAAFTLVGNTGVVSPTACLGGISFNTSGELFAAQSDILGNSVVYQVNPSTGAVIVGPWTIGIKYVEAIAFGPAPTSPPLPPPAPGAGGGNGGVGPEGGFGFGPGPEGGRSGLASVRHSSLSGPFPRPDQTGMMVVNVSHCQAQCAEDQSSPVWLLVSATLLPAGLLWLLRRTR